MNEMNGKNGGNPGGRPPMPKWQAVLVLLIFAACLYFLLTRFTHRGKSVTVPMATPLPMPTFGAPALPTFPPLP